MVFLQRFVSAFLLIEAGGMKLFGWFGLMPGGPVHLVSQLGLAGVLEVFGGSVFLLGLFTRPVAFILSGEMAVAYLAGSCSLGSLANCKSGSAGCIIMFYIFIFAAYDGGKFSLDAIIKKHKIKYLNEKSNFINQCYS